MVSHRLLAGSVSVLALAATLSLSTTADARTASPPLHPVGHVGPYLPAYQAPEAAKSGTWTAPVNKFPGTGGADTSLLMTDGTVIMHDICTANWYRLTPDSKGSYIKGTWSALPAMPSGYTPLYFASQVMPDADSRVVVNGGEYINCSPVWTTMGAIFDPVTNKWASVNPPSGWSTIGDAQSVILPDGSYMLANCCTTQEAIGSIDSKGKATWTTTGTGKADSNDEEGWSLLPTNNIISVDANKDLGLTYSDAELYTTLAGTWASAGHTASDLVDTNSHELGPAVLRPDGTLFYFGGTPNTNVYTPSTGKWAKGPAFPIAGYDVADGPAALLPDGNVLVQASPGVFQTPSHFFETDGKTLTQVNDTPTAPNITSYEGRMLVLPSGQILWGADNGDVEIYTPKGKAKGSWAPKIKTAPASVTHGGTGYTLTGKQLNGLSFGAAYGDDAQMSTNYPIVRIKNTGTGAVCYARTHDFSSGVALKKTTSTMFDVPSTCTTGASTLVVVANGIASKSVNVTVN